jgi:hypothetical protein
MTFCPAPRRIFPRSSTPPAGIGTVNSIAFEVVTVESAFGATPNENVIAAPDLFATNILVFTIVPLIVGAVYTVVSDVVDKLLLANNPDGDGILFFLNLN